MENCYVISTTNRYDLFYNEDEDPMELIKSQEKEKESRKKTKSVSEKENRGKVEVKGVGPAVPRKGIKETSNIKVTEVPKTKDDTNKVKPNTRPPVDRNARPPADNREERNNRRNREDTRPAQEYREKDREPREGPKTEGGEGVAYGGRGRGRGGPGRGSRGRGRGGRGGVGGKREFDRQSGSEKSGVKPVDKRGGAGAHNWGTYHDEEQVEIGNPVEDNQEWGDRVEAEQPLAAEVEQKDVEGTEGGEPNGAPPEEGVGQLTLDEWKAKKAPRAKPVFNVRKPGEGEDLNQWKKMYVLKKNDGKDNDDDDEEDETTEYLQRSGRQKRLHDIPIQFNDARRGGRGRGRGTRGGPGRGGPRGGQRGGNTAAPGGRMQRFDAEEAAPIYENSVETVRPEVGRAENNRGSRGGRGRYGAPAAGPEDQTGETRIGPQASQRGSGNWKPRGGSRQSAPKVDDEKDFPSLG